MAGANKASVLSIALLVVTLAAGFFVGMAWQKNRVVADAAEEGADDQPRERNDRRMVIDDVGLESGKRAEVEEIIQHFFVQMRALHEEYEPMRVRIGELNDEYEQAYRPQQRELIRQARDSIKSILMPGQRALYDSLLAVRYGNSDRGRDEPGNGRGRGGPDRGEER